ncbi:hypothetical protein SODG_005890 [Sodalis praecaptivus]
MKPYQSDILYSVNANGVDGYVYCLIEHQSTPDKLMAWRLMRYCMAAMQRHLEAGHDKLPLVFPVLFYCGEKVRIRTAPTGWTALNGPISRRRFTASRSGWRM